VHHNSIITIITITAIRKPRTKTCRNIWGRQATSSAKLLRERIQ